MSTKFVSTILKSAICIVATALSGAMVAQSTDNLEIDTPAQWTVTRDFEQTLPVDDAWWHSLGDPVLDSLIAKAFQNNYNALAAMKRITVAQNQLAQARWGYAPGVNVSAGWTKNRTSGRMTQVATDPVTSSYFNAAVSASWEIDVFGRIHERVKQAGASVNISRAEYAAVQVSLAANVANAYIQLRSAQTQLKVANEHIASQANIVRMTEARHEAGLASKLDVTEAKIVLYSTQASIPALKAQIQTTANTLATLTGEYPGDVPTTLAENSPMPQYRQLIAIGVPADLLRRRPDIIQAENTVAADAASIGIAKKDFLPTLTLNGSIGTAAHDIGNMFGSKSLTYSIQPTLTWTVFSGMSRRYNIMNAREQMQIDVDNYNLTVLQAVQEVQDAIAEYNSALQQISLYTNVVDQAKEELKLSVDLYKNSLSPFSNVVTAQMNVLQYRINLVQSEAKALQSLVSLYQALGGGWDTNL